ncbi:MAG: PQQ-like beta-propeller repeat protein [Candidatus Omnitrophica bacterium]|nr:PQQ-like beta-propeller repeat protein [Candidatus Omnitrophota bacterium]
MTNVIHSSTSSSTPILWRQSAVRIAMAAGGFCLAVCLLLAIDYFRSLRLDPLHSPELAQLKVALGRNPGNEQIKQQIRLLDLELRQAHAEHEALGAKAGWLLLGGAGVLLLAIKYAMYRKKLPRPEKKKYSPGAARRAVVLARSAVVVVAGAVIASVCMLSLRSESNLPSPATKTSAVAKSTNSPAAQAAAPITPYPTPEEIQRNWPRFRGPGGLGISIYTNVPVSWNAKTGEGVLWKSPVPMVGPSSPIVWQDRVFLTGASKTKREVYCYDANTGKLLWQKPVENVPNTSPDPPTVMEDSGGYAASTPATDGRRVYAIYANGNVAAFDFQGNLAWSVGLGLPDNNYGHTSSLTTYQDRLLVLFDQGTGKDGKSRLIALDSKTGKLAWQTEPRPVPNSWATPIVIHTPQNDQIITCGNPWAIAYNAASGTELWRAKVLYGEVVPSPIFAAGLVFTAIDGEKVSAIRPDGTGDVSKSHIAWSADEGLPDICSPLSDNQRIYMLGTYGLLSCYDIQTGKELWEKELELGFHSSPSLAGDRIYLFSDKGVGVVLQAGAEFKELARSDLGEDMLASPAFADGRIYVRGKEHLFCLGKK